MNSENIVEKEIAYMNLVDERKKCMLCSKYRPIRLLNPSVVKEGLFDNDEIGPWSLWQGSLDAKIMVIGKDFSTAKYFIDNKGKDQINNKTNIQLMESLKSIGIMIEHHISKKGSDLLFFTNSVLCLKEDVTKPDSQQDMSADLKNIWIETCSERFLKRLINIIKPKAIIVLGKDAFKAVAHIYSLYSLPEVKRGSSLKITEIIERGKPFEVENGTLIFTVAHPAYAKRNRPEPKNSNDWAVIKTYLSEILK